MKVAIVGSGISALAVAHGLADKAALTIFEAADYFGGHTHTVDVRLPGPHGQITHGVDTGFLVFNERTYPNLIQLFADLGVETTPSDMSFSVQASASNGRRVEWSGSDLGGVFAQKRNLISPRFLGMLRDLARFNALTSHIAETGTERQLQQPLHDFLDHHRFGDAFRNWYFLPMIACIWSCPKEQMLRFPVSTMIRFCHNHGLNQVSNRPQWHTVKGGARHYVDKILARVADKRLCTPVRAIHRHAGVVTVTTEHGAERFDRVVIATHSDQALALLHDASEAERATLGAIRYQPNHAVLHTDTSVLPTRPRAWAAWNYENLPPAGGASGAETVCLHYLINRLQPLPWTQAVIVSLNPQRPIAERQILGQFDYAHPVFDQGAINAQATVAQLQGQRNTYFCGAWMGYGFHEDGLKAGQSVAQHLMRDLEHLELQAA